ncbi:MAG: DsbA family protein [Rhodospirillum sp.]|nr:DsbA family protein [Rhodospirillum sp.]MCF8492159.1 DsbA family protein [Rhodospirillum sp.]MCF8499624.1 DsbA family protein [Rhodospirillum sp.]
MALSLGVLSLGAMEAPAGAAEPLTPEQTEAVKSLIREHLIANPEILKEAFQALKAKEDAEEKANQASMIKELGPMLTDPKDLPTLGNAKGDVTVVEFSDYNCGYCKRVFPVLWDTVTSDGNIKLHVMEYPILGPDSVLGARAALAVALQDEAKYEPFHKALMAHKGKITEDILTSLAKDQGVDTDKMKKDMNSEDVDAKIARSFQLAQALGISGTPAFIIGDQLIPGAMGPDTLTALIKDARAAK